MLRYIDHKKMGKGIHDWLESHFHFSFAEYFNPDNIHFGVLRVLNDDIVQPGKGFNPHPHKDMEILSYVVNGELSHKDSMGNMHTLTRGQVQYMSAGTGVIHSEMNEGKEAVRFLQMWILPDKKGHEPAYGDYRFSWESRIGKWLPIATGHNTGKAAPIKVNADVNVYATVINAGETIKFEVEENRQAYMALIEGDAKVEYVNMVARDALEIVGQDVHISTEHSAHIYMIEMARDVVEQGN